jgi:hypothetical protein
VAVNGYVIVGFVVGVALVIKHFVTAIKAGKGPRLDRALELIVVMQGATVGVRVIYVCLTTKHLGPLNQEDRIFAAFGGVALIWVAVLSAMKELREDKSDEDD